MLAAHTDATVLRAEHTAPVLRGGNWARTGHSVMTLTSVSWAHHVLTTASTLQDPTPVSLETVPRTRCIAMESVSHAVRVSMFGKMDDVNFSAVRDTRLRLDSAPWCVRMGQWRGMACVSQCVHWTPVMAMAHVIATLTSTNVSARMDTAETSANVVLDTDIMMVGVWTLMSAMSCSHAPSCVTIPRDHINATVRMDSSRFLAAKMCVRILMNAI